MHETSRFVYEWCVIRPLTRLHYCVGRRVDGVKSDLEKRFDEAACRQPAIVLLENLDDLVPAPTAGAAEGVSEVMYSTKLAESVSWLLAFHVHVFILMSINSVICDMINGELQRNTVLALMATVRSADSLHPRLLPGRGQHYFQKVLELSMPSEVRS